MKEIRVGIIGTGMISNRHIWTYRNIEKYADILGFKATVAAICDIDGQRVNEWGDMYGIPEKDRYTDFRELLKRDDLDTIDVCVHNNMHTPITIAALKAGFDCYTEKPIAASYHDGRMIVDCAKKLGRKFHVQISSLMTPQTRVAKKMIDEGKLGDIYYMNLERVAHRGRSGYDITMFTSDFNLKEIAGHGNTIDIGIYLISQLLYLAGLPKLKSVNGFSGKFMETDDRLLARGGHFGIEDISDGFAKFENGMGFHYMFSPACNHSNYDMTYILGTKGGLEIRNQDVVGGKYAKIPEDPVFPDPELRFIGDLEGRDVVIDLNCGDNGRLEERLDPLKICYNNNQIMWLAYKTGLLDDTTRYNTPEIALNMLLLSDGIFLSQELGREVTAEEIMSLSPALYTREQQIGSELVKFDVDF